MKMFVRTLLIAALLALLVSCTQKEDDGMQVKMTAKIESIDQKIEVTVIEGEYGASGTYLVITGDATAYLDKDGKSSGREALAVGDTVEIIYGGQVMMSIPPQIVAKQIKITE